MSALHLNQAGLFELEQAAAMVCVMDIAFESLEHRGKLEEHLPLYTSALKDKIEAALRKFEREK